jgi:hypothetical protein
MEAILMSTQSDRFARYPQQVRASKEGTSSTYLRQPGYYAVHDRPPGCPAPDAHQLLNDGAIAIYQGDPGDRTAAGEGTLGPVYALQPGGTPAVPTGLLFVRFADGVPAEARRPAFEQAGYEIVKSPRYAPHTAWVRSRSRDMAAALEGLPALERLPDVENVEPQMLMASIPRDPPADPATGRSTGREGLTSPETTES